MPADLARYTDLELDGLLFRLKEFDPRAQNDPGLMSERQQIYAEKHKRWTLAMKLKPKWDE